MADPWTPLLVGLGLGTSLAAPPGPIMAKMAFETARGRWRQGLLVGLGASTADALYFVLVLVGLLRVLPDPRILGALAFLGVVLMDLFAYQAWRAARRPLVAPTSRWNGWPAGFALAITSPFNVAWWITSGAPFLETYGGTLGIGFFAALLFWVGASVAVFAYGSAKVRRFETYVAYASAALLSAFGLLLAFTAFRFLLGGPG